MASLLLLMTAAPQVATAGDSPSASSLAAPMGLMTADQVPSAAGQNGATGVLPAFSMQRDLPPVSSQVDPRRASSPASSGAVIPIGPQAIIVKPGVNEIIPIAVGQVNRLITPFNQAEVVTSSTVTPDVRGNVLYVAPNSEDLVTYYVTEKGSEAVAISLTLVPRKIPPREITLQLSSQDQVVLAEAIPEDRPDTSWEQNEPYMTSVVQVMRDLALHKMPPGYVLRPRAPDDRLPPCRTNGTLWFDFSTAQTLVGGRLEVMVGVVGNAGSVPEEVREPICADDQTIAIAVWPNSLVQPGSRSEIYILRKRIIPEEVEEARPSLVQ